MTPARPDPARLSECAALSAKFAEAQWQPSDRNFAPRPFVTWHGSFFSVAGTPPGSGPVATSCRTPAEVLTFLAQYPPAARKVTDEQLEEARTQNPRYFSAAKPTPKVQSKPEPEPQPKPEAPPEQGEPIPDNLARLIPETIEQAKHREWLRTRWLELGHKVNAPKVFGVTSAEIKEHEQLERYRGLFA